MTAPALSACTIHPFDGHDVHNTLERCYPHTTASCLGTSLSNPHRLSNQINTEHLHHPPETERTARVLRRREFRKGWFAAGAVPEAEAAGAQKEQVKND